MSSDRIPYEADEPGLGFQAGFGFYLGLVVTGFVAIGGVLADVSTGSLLGILPSTVTTVTIVGHIVAKRAHGLPERIGGSRRRRLASYLPSVAFALISFVLGPAVGAVSITARLTVMTIVFVLLTAVSAFGVNRLCRKRYVEAITGDDPAVRWTATRTVPFFGGKVKTGFGTVILLSGLTVASTGDWYGLFWALYGVMFLAEEIEDRLDWFDSGEGDGGNQESEVSAYDVGLVVGDRTFVPCDTIGDVRLTDDELVIEREDSWFDLRYDRSSIDDPEAVREGIERARAGADAPERERPDLRDRDDDRDLEGEPTTLEADEPRPEPESELGSEAESDSAARRSGGETGTETETDTA